jgi:hypothetical protein
MAFLRDLLVLPITVSPFLMIVCGYPKEDATVPYISKKELEKIATFI